MSDHGPFSLEEIFAYAIDAEIKALEFYDRSADRTDNVEVATFFRALARMEAGHRRALEAELESLRSAGALSPSPLAATIEPDHEDMLTALQRVTRTLRDANVDLQGRHQAIQAELEVAAQVQSSLLPERAPQLEGLDISVACHMASQLGGDFYDFLYDPVGQLAFTLGDVSGKGLPAALLMVALRTLWRSRIRDGRSPHRVLDFLTQDVAAELSQGDHFVTMVTGVYDPALSTLSFANAGHWAPIYLSADEGYAEFPPPYMPVGMDADTRYESFQLVLQPGDVVVFFSDGIVEARVSGGDEYSEERLRALVEANRHRSAEYIRDVIIADVDDFTGGERSDDQTLMVLVRRRPSTVDL